jgi:hypothetical protein
MFRWYQETAKYYVYLLDILIIKRKTNDKFSEFT